MFPFPAPSSKCQDHRNSRAKDWPPPSAHTTAMAQPLALGPSVLASRLLLVLVVIGGAMARTRLAFKDCFLLELGSIEVRQGDTVVRFNATGSVYTAIDNRSYCMRDLGEAMVQTNFVFSASSGPGSPEATFAMAFKGDTSSDDAAAVSHERNRRLQDARDHQHGPARGQGGHADADVLLDHPAVYAAIPTAANIQDGKEIVCSQRLASIGNKRGSKRTRKCCKGKGEGKDVRRHHGTRLGRLVV